MMARSIHFLRIALVLQAIAFGCAFLIENYVALSDPAAQYEALFDAIGEGINVRFLLQKAFVLLAVVLWLSGAFLVWMRESKGLPLLALSGPLLCIATIAGATQGGSFPPLEPIPALLLWCLGSSAWGGSLALGWNALRGKRLTIGLNDHGAEASMGQGVGR